MTSRPAWILALTGLLSAFAAADQLAGTVTYRERMALPPQAIVTIRLEESSGDLISEVRFASGSKQVPISFSMNYEDSAVRRGRSYQISAFIHAKDQLLFESRKPVAWSVGSARRVDLLVARASERPSPGSTNLYNFTWRLLDLGGKPAIQGRSGVPSIRFDREPGTVSGTTGVNQFSGPFRIGAIGLNIGDLRQTLIGGSPELAEQERLFTAMLGNANGFRVDGERLRLLQGSRVIATFRRES